MTRPVPATLYGFVAIVPVGMLAPSIWLCDELLDRHGSPSRKIYSCR
jgi:hypothetical protein